MSSFPKTPGQVAELSIDHPDITEVLENTYDKLHAEAPDAPREEIHVHGLCMQASSILVSELAGLGYRAHMFVANTGDDLNWEEHAYTLLRSSRGVMVVDPTWVQFHDNPGWDVPYRLLSHHPKALVGTRSEVIDYARESGLDEVTLSLWSGKHGRLSRQPLIPPLHKIAN